MKQRLDGFSRAVFPRSGLLGDLLAGGCFVLLSLVAFAPEILLGMRLMDADILGQSIPVQSWYGRAVRQGGDSLWTSGILGGFPIAFTQYSLLSPIDWLAARLFDPDRAFAVGLAVHLPLAGIASYFYARVMGISRVSSLLAGVGYQLSTESLALGINGYLLRTLFLLPSLLLSAELVARGSVRWAALAALAVGFALVSGTAYVAAIALLSGGLYVLARGLMLWRQGSVSRAMLLMGSMGAAVVLGVGLAAARVLPGLVVTGESVRARGLSFGAAVNTSPDLGLLLGGYLLPLTRLLEPNFGDPPSYVGPAVLALAALSLFRWRSRPWLLVLGILTGVNLLASLGENGPLFRFIHEVPLFAFFRNASRFSTATALFLSVLAAAALDRESRPRGKGLVLGILKLGAIVSTLVFFLAIGIGLLWVYGGDVGGPIRAFAESNGLGPANPLRPRVGMALGAIPATLWALHARETGQLSRAAFQLSFLGLTTALLLGVGLVMIPMQKPEPAIPATVQYLRSDPSPFRVLANRPGVSVYNYLLHFALRDPRRVNRHGPAELDFEHRYMSESLALNHALQWGLESADGYEVLQSIRQATALAYLGSDSTGIGDLVVREDDVGGQQLMSRIAEVRWIDVVERLPVLRAFNVKYVLSNVELGDASGELRLVFTSWIRSVDPYPPTAVNVYEVARALSRAYVVPEAVSANSAVQALDALLRRHVDPSRAVILEWTGVPSLAGHRLDPGRSTVAIASRADSEMVLQVQTDGAGFLVVNDAFYPGWKAWVDGVEIPILVANGWVMGVPIEGPGDHSIRLSYTPPLLAEGMAISLAAVMACLLFVAIPWVRRA